MKRETRALLERGIKEELNTDGRCIHRFPQYETLNYLEMYDKLEEIRPIDDLIADSMARLWDEYFTLGKKKYKEKHKITPLESKPDTGYIINKQTIY